MKRKNPKVEEPAAPYLAKKPPARVGRMATSHAGDAAFSRAAEKVFAERKDLLRKLAQ
ncbi:MAG: hypothetical protein KF897_10090 [Opitutaceae bacterium]|nr:hypothetical protein [Opitutaceae bacterium]